MHNQTTTTARSSEPTSDDATLIGSSPHVTTTDSLQTDTQIRAQRSYLRGLLTFITLGALVACTRDPETGTPVPNDPSVNEKGVDTVVKRQPMPQAEHAKEPPLGALDPRTGDPREEVDPVVRLNDAGHEAK